MSLVSIPNWKNHDQGLAQFVLETPTFRGVLDATIDDLHRARGKVRAEKDPRFYEKKMRVFGPA